MADGTSTHRMPVALVDADGRAVTAARDVLESVGYPVVAYENAASFLRDPRSRRIACIVSEFILPDMSGLAWLEALRTRQITAPVVFVTHVMDLRAGVAAIKQGAIDFLTKPAGSHDVIDAVRQGARIDRYRRRRTRENDEYLARRQTLTRRELDLVGPIAHGHANQVIARTLSISGRTVETHRGRIMRKLGISSVAELAMRESWTDTGQGRCPYCYRPLDAEFGAGRSG